MMMIMLIFVYPASFRGHQIGLGWSSRSICDLELGFYRLGGHPNAIPTVKDMFSAFVILQNWKWRAADYNKSVRSEIRPASDVVVQESTDLLNGGMEEGEEEGQEYADNKHVEE